MLPALILLISVTASFSTETFTPQDCLTSYPNIKLDCVQPIQQQFTESKSLCKNLCFKSIRIASSCQYNEHSSICEILDVTVPIDNADMAASSIIDEQKVRKGIRLAEDYRPQNVPRCEPSVIPSIGNTLIIVDVKCTSNLTTTKIDNFMGDEKKFAKNLAPLNMYYSAAKIADALQPVTETESDVDVVENLTRLGSMKNSFRSVTKGRKDRRNSDCLAGFSLRFEIIQGVEILSKPSISFKADSPDVCLYACKNNHANGTRSPTNCLTAQYDRIHQRCTFFDNSITPSGSAQYEPNKDVIYFEKICLPESLTQNCYGALRRVPQYVLLGHATAVVDAWTHNSCVEMCMRSTEKYGFECRSAIHFYEYPSLNCILNTHSARTRPKFFSAELKQKVDYIEMNDCQEKIKKDHRRFEGFTEVTEEPLLKK